MITYIFRKALLIKDREDANLPPIDIDWADARDGLEAVFDKQYKITDLYGVVVHKDWCEKVVTRGKKK